MQFIKGGRTGYPVLGSTTGPPCPGL